MDYVSRYLFVFRLFGFVVFFSDFFCVHLSGRLTGWPYIIGKLCHTPALHLSSAISFKKISLKPVG